MDFVTPTTSLIAMVVVAALGGAAGWFLRTLRERSETQARDVWESEMARAASCARDRAFEERGQAEQRLSRLQEEHGGCEAIVDGLAKKLQVAISTRSALESELLIAAETHEANEIQIRSLNARIAELESSIEKRDQRDGAPGWLLAEPDGATDRLSAIKGLGSVLEQRLNSLGIYRYHQLARMTPANARWIAMKLKVVPGRILRDRWAEQAREMLTRRPN